MDSVDALDIVAPALVAGILIASIHGPLGIEVLRRGIIFIDLAIAQIAGLCVVLVDLFTHEDFWVLRQVVALGGALGASGRYAIGLVALHYTNGNFYWGTILKKMTL